MDADAFWSLCGFYFLLEKFGKDVKATNDEAMPESFSFITSKHIIEPNLNIKNFNPEVIISFDAASLEQLWKTYADNKETFSKVPFVVIDHHITNPLFWNLNIVNIKASSSCELVFDIITELWFNNLLDEEIATCLLTGIHTDTNTFYNKNTTSHTMNVAAKLLDLWGKNKEIIFEFFRKKSLEKVHLWWKIMQQVQQLNGITYVSVKKEIYKDTANGDQWFKGFISEFLANIEGTQVALFLYEQKDNKEIKASLRSNRDDINVAELCVEFWGGWHKLAAGFSYYWEIKDLEKILLQKLKKVVS